MKRNKKIIISVLTVCIMFTLALGGCASSDDGDLLFLNGVEDYNNQEYASAIDKLTKAETEGLKRYKIGDLYTYLGHCYSELDMYENAIEYYQMALEENPDKVEYIVNLAITYRQSGDNKKAMELYLQALELEPDYAELNSSLGSLYILENNPEQAIIYFNKAIEQDSSLAVAYGNGALAYALIGDFEKADEYLEKAIVRGYSNAEAIRERIDALRNK